ncbi:MAG: LytR/AlgR family response regulator transcription factor [Saprospiraceae bacterium]
MRCIIVDDEPLAREGMEMNVEELDYLNLIGQFSTAVDALNFLNNNQVDLIFLDIQMPGLTGLDFVRAIQSLKDRPMVILSTAYPQYALEGFELEVIDYLVKPNRLQRFIQAVSKAKILYDLKQEATNTPTTVAEEDIFIRADRKYIRIFFRDIKYIKGMKDYVMIYTGKEKFMTAMNIKTTNQQLPNHQFVRVNKSYIVNADFIDSIGTDFINIGKDEIPLGRTYREDFITRFVKGKLIERK